MSETARKKKTVILRLSDAEYETLRLNYRSFGVESVSEFARLALQRTLVESAEADCSPTPSLAELDSRLRNLESKVLLLMARDKVAH